MEKSVKKSGQALLKQAIGVAALMGLSWQANAANSCFDAVDYIKPSAMKTERALYVLVDQTTPLSGEMRQRISALIENWGQPGDRVKVAQFSANVKGKYPQLIFDGHVEATPGEDYFYQLRWADKKQVMACLEDQQKAMRDQFQAAVKSALSGIDPKIPKTELLYSLKEISRQVVVPDEANSQIVLLISDGMENSPTTSFYAKGALRALDARKEISKIRRAGLIGHWKGAEVYIYGLGIIEKDKVYIRPDHVKKLGAFWEQYFVEGGARIKAMGTPELLVSKID